MEDALRVLLEEVNYHEIVVLILVLMEDALRVMAKLNLSSQISAVLILVLMEDALREPHNQSKEQS